jgi:hypothetical protein
MGLLQKEDITIAIADDESLSLQLQEDLQPVAEVALKVAESLRTAIHDEERRGYDMEFYMHLFTS